LISFQKEIFKIYKIFGKSYQVQAEVYTYREQTCTPRAFHAVDGLNNSWRPKARVFKKQQIIFFISSMKI